LGLIGSYWDLVGLIVSYCVLLGLIGAYLVLLGIVTSIYVATSRSIKEGDLIEIPKYKIKGNLLDISLITTKIKNLDETISTIPTYDLLTTEVKNYDAKEIHN